MGHDSTITVVDGETNSSSFLRTSFLPFLTIIWTAPDTVICAGHQLTPVMFRVSKSGDSVQIQCVGKVQQAVQRQELGGLSAMRKFQSLDRHARIINDDVCVNYSKSKFIKIITIIIWLCF